MSFLHVCKADFERERERESRREREKGSQSSKFLIIGFNLYIYIIVMKNILYFYSNNSKLASILRERERDRR